jgi:hypothetical protein
MAQFSDSGYWIERQRTVFCKAIVHIGSDFLMSGVFGKDEDDEFTQQVPGQVEGDGRIRTADRGFGAPALTAWRRRLTVADVLLKLFIEIDYP